jgi:hypothetical protein
MLRGHPQHTERCFGKVHILQTVSRSRNSVCHSVRASSQGCTPRGAHNRIAERVWHFRTHCYPACANCIDTYGAGCISEGGSRLAGSFLGAACQQQHVSSWCSSARSTWGLLWKQLQIGCFMTALKGSAVALLAAGRAPIPIAQLQCM